MRPNAKRSDESASPGSFHDYMDRLAECVSPQMHEGMSSVAHGTEEGTVVNLDTDAEEHVDRPCKRRALEETSPAFAETGLAFAVPSEPFRASQFGSNVEAVFWSLPKQPEPLMPWETGPTAQVFTKQPDVLKQPWRRPEVPHLFTNVQNVQPCTGPESAQPSRAMAEGGGPYFATVVSSAKTHSDEVAKYESRRREAVRKWLVIILSSRTNFPLKQQVEEARLAESGEDAVLEIVDDVCAMKSPGTMAKRAGSLLRYLAWAKQGAHLEGMPPTEPLAYMYVKDLSSRPHATAARSFRESLNFAKHVLGFDGLDLALQSRRIEGVCKRLVFEGEESISFEDPGYIEMTTKNHKTALMFHKRNKLLPIAVPLVTFGPKPGWWFSWKEAAAAIGIDFFLISALRSSVASSHRCTGSEQMLHHHARSL